MSDTDVIAVVLALLGVLVFVLVASGEVEREGRRQDAEWHETWEQMERIRKELRDGQNKGRN